MMRPGRRLIPAIAICTGLGLGTATASAQGYGTAGSLGGYGAASGFATPGMGNSSPMIIPYGGKFEGFMPGRMGGGSVSSFRSRPTATMGPARTSFGLSPLSGGMSSMSGGLTGPRAGSRGTMGLGGMRRMPGVGGTSVMPPRIGYPFRQPPSLVSPSATGTGMSM